MGKQKLNGYALCCQLKVRDLSPLKFLLLLDFEKFTFLEGLSIFIENYLFLGISLKKLKKGQIYPLSLDI
jgi:hypothetical protein